MAGISVSGRKSCPPTTPSFRSSATSPESRPHADSTGSRSKVTRGSTAFCLDTDELLCVECLFLSKFKELEVVSIEKAYKSKLQDFKQDLKTVDIKTKKLSIASKEYEKQTESFKETNAAVAAYLQETFAEIWRLVDQSMKRVAAEMEACQASAEARQEKFRCEIAAVMRSANSLYSHETLEPEPFLAKAGERKEVLQLLDRYCEKRPEQLEGMQKGAVDREVEELLRALQKSKNERNSVVPPPKAPERSNVTALRNPPAEKGCSKLVPLPDKPNVGVISIGLSAKDANNPSQSTVNLKQLKKDVSKKSITRSKSPILKTDMLALKRREAKTAKLLETGNKSALGLHQTNRDSEASAPNLQEFSNKPSDPFDRSLLKRNFESKSASRLHKNTNSTLNVKHDAPQDRPFGDRGPSRQNSKLSESNLQQLSVTSMATQAQESQAVYQPMFTDRLQINYLDDQRLSYLADSIQTNNGLKSSGLKNALGLVHRFELPTEGGDRTAEQSSSNVSVWQKRKAGEKRPDAENHKKNQLGLAEQSEYFFEDKENRPKLASTIKMREYWSPNNSRLILDFNTPELPAPRGRSPEAKEESSADMVRQEGSSSSQAAKKKKPATTREANSQVHRFEFEDTGSKGATRPASKTHGKTPSSKSRLSSPRRSQENSQLFAVGGSSDKDHVTIERFDSAHDSWTEVYKSALALEGRSKFGAVQSGNGAVLVFGGKAANKRFRDAFVFDAGKGCLKESAFQLSEAKSGFGFCTMNGRPGSPRQALRGRRQQRAGNPQDLRVLRPRLLRRRPAARHGLPQG